MARQARREGDHQEAERLNREAQQLQEKAEIYMQNGHDQAARQKRLEGVVKEPDSPVLEDILEVNVYTLF